MNSALGHGSTGKDKTPLAQVATWITAAAGIFSEIGSSAPAALPRDVAFLCEDAVADAGGLAPMDLESLNHRLRWNVNSARGYERPVDLVIARAARSSLPSRRPPLVSPGVLASHALLDGAMTVPSFRR